MKKLKKTIFIIFVVVLCLIAILYSYQKSRQSHISFPSLLLKGEDTVTLEAGQVYLEDGYVSKDKKDGDLTKKVTIKDDTDSNVAGVYKRVYEVVNSYNQTTKVTRSIVVKKKSTPIYKDSYNGIDNTKRTWWSSNKKDGSRPVGAYDKEELKKYDAYFMGKDEKVIYLTFDEGANDTYVKEIVDVLNNNKVKATFFFCRRFILDNPELVRNIEKTGHSVGNHTANHKNMPTFATAEAFPTYLYEMKAVEDAYYSVTGKQMDKVYREPKGEWSLRSLQIIKDLGYRNYFWSADYLDFNGDVAKEYALTQLKKRVHNGAIYLIHPSNKGNYEAMDSFIRTMKNEGYTFDLVKSIKS